MGKGRKHLVFLLGRHGLSHPGTRMHVHTHMHAHTLMLKEELGGSVAQLPIRDGLRHAAYRQGNGLDGLRRALHS